MSIADSRFLLIVVVCLVKALTAGGTGLMEYGGKSMHFDSEFQWF